MVAGSTFGCRSEQSNQTLPLHRHETTPHPAYATRAVEPARLPQALFVEYVSTPHDVVNRMLALARLTRDDVLYDLGCGDGRILVAAARKYGCRAVGYDLDPLRVNEARANARRHGVTDRVTVELRDIFEVDLSEATVVTLYLGTELNARLLPALRQLTPGVRIVSHDFGLADIPPDKVVKTFSREDRRQHMLYRWTCPLRSAPETANPAARGRSAEEMRK
jgi:SAM-dependent methyltransferase